MFAHEIIIVLFILSLHAKLYAVTYLERNKWYGNKYGYGFLSSHIYIEKWMLAFGLYQR